MVESWTKSLAISDILVKNASFGSKSIVTFYFSQTFFFQNFVLNSLLLCVIKMCFLFMQEMLLLLLPLLNSSSLKSLFRPFSKDKSSDSTAEETSCPVCQGSPSIPFIALPCRHRCVATLFFLSFSFTLLVFRFIVLEYWLKVLYRREQMVDLLNTIHCTESRLLYNLNSYAKYIYTICDPSTVYLWLLQEKSKERIQLH